MASVHAERLTAQVDREIVLFLIGMRVNRPWKIATWLPVFLPTTDDQVEPSRETHESAVDCRQFNS